MGRELSPQPLPQQRRMTNRNHMGFSESPHEAVLQHVSTPEALEQFVAVARQARQQGHAPVRARCIYPPLARWMGSTELAGVSTHTRPAQLPHPWGAAS